MKLFTVCIVHYGDNALLERCLDSVGKNSVGNEEVYVWMNGQATGHWPGPGLFFWSPENWGFNGPANKLASAAETDYIVFLNSDAVVGPGWLERLFKPFISTPKVGVTGPKGGCRTLTITGDGAAGERIDYIEGSCMMTPRALFLSMGGFDTETFRFAYAEDADYCLRLRERGWKVVEVELPGYEHERAVTSKVVQAEGKIDLKGLATINNMRLLERWHSIIEKGSFRRRIVVHRSAARGDAFQLTALARIVADRVPHWRLYADTPWPELFEHNPLISPVSDLVGPADHVDLDGAYESRPTVPIAIAYAQALGVPGPIPLRMPELYLTPVEKLDAQCDTIGKVAVLHPGWTGWPGKDAPIELWLAIVAELRKRHFEIAVCGDKQTPDLGCDNDLRDMPFRQVAARIGNAALFIGVDSFPAHLAYAARTPAVVLFGAVPPERVIVERAFAEPVMAGHLACLGCHLEGPQPRLFSGCTRDRIEVHAGKSAACMNELSVDQILAAAEKVRGWRTTMPTEVSKSGPGFWAPHTQGKGLNLACGLDRSFDCDTFDRTPYFWADMHGDVRDRLPYDNDTYDWVLTSHNLEDLVVPDWTVREIGRILKPGGRILAYVPTKKYDEGGGYNEDHVRIFDEPSLKFLLERSGFQNIQIIDDQEDDKYSILGVGVKGSDATR